MKKKLTLLLASGFGIGLVVPFAPGTFGSLPGLALAYGVTILPLWLQIPGTCGAAEFCQPLRPMHQKEVTAEF